MKYEKPTIMDLGERARRVDGANAPNVCYPGATASGGGYGGSGEVCVGGGAPTYNNACNPGGTFVGAACTNGTSPADPAFPGYLLDCYNGTTPGDICNAGTSPVRADPYGCTSGPVIVP